MENKFLFFLVITLVVTGTKADLSDIMQNLTVDFPTVEALLDEPIMKEIHQLDKQEVEESVMELEKEEQKDEKKIGNEYIDFCKSIMIVSKMCGLSKTRVAARKNTLCRSITNELEILFNDYGLAMKMIGYVGKRILEQGFDLTLDPLELQIIGDIVNSEIKLDIESNMMKCYSNDCECGLSEKLKGSAGFNNDWYLKWQSGAKSVKEQREEAERRYTFNFDSEGCTGQGNDSGLNFGRLLKSNSNKINIV